MSGPRRSSLQSPTAPSAREDVLYPNLSDAGTRHDASLRPKTEKASAMRRLPDSAILIMGLTGSGKSTFISLLANEPVRIGHELTSCTSTVQGYTVTIDDRSIFLLDTPGFDDTERSDVEILSEIALYLNTLHFSPVQLLGVIYVQRITDTRMSGSSLKSLKIFEGLCGLQASPNIIFVTTMWDKLGSTEDKIGEERLKELEKVFLANMVNKGAQVHRHDGEKASAQAILRQMLTQNRPVVLNIQHEMGDQGLPLERTTVGQFLQRSLIDQQQNHDAELKEIEQQLEEAKQSNDKTAISMLKEDSQRHRSQLIHLQELRQQLQVNFEQLGTQRDPHFSTRVQEARRANAEDENEDLKRRLQFTTQRKMSIKDEQKEERYSYLEQKARLDHAERGHVRETLVRAERRKLQKKKEKQEAGISLWNAMATWLMAGPTVEYAWQYHTGT